MDKKDSTVTMKSTKETMFQALQGANNKIKELEKIKNNPQEEMVKKHEKVTVEEAECVIEKNDLDKCLSQMSDTLNSTINTGIETYKKAMQDIDLINESINIKKKELEELYKVDAEFLKFSTAVNAQMDEKGKFETEFDELKKQRIQELEDLNKQITEAKEILKNDASILKKQLDFEHKKEEELFQYTKDRKRKIDEDNWNDDMSTKKKEFEAIIKQKEDELDKREINVLERETKMKELENQIENMPIKIKEAVDKAVEESEKSSKRSYTFETTILKKDYEGKIAVINSKMETFEANAIKDAELIKDLQSRLNDSYKEIKDMAAKSVEGASNQKAYTTIENTLKSLQKSSDK